MKEFSAYQQILEESRKPGESKARRPDLLYVVEVRVGKRGARSFERVVESVRNPSKLRALLKFAAT